MKKQLDAAKKAGADGDAAASAAAAAQKKLEDEIAQLKKDLATANGQVTTQQVCLQFTNFSVPSSHSVGRSVTRSFAVSASSNLFQPPAIALPSPSLPPYFLCADDPATGLADAHMG